MLVMVPWYGTGRSEAAFTVAVPICHRITAVSLYISNGSTAVLFAYYAEVSVLRVGPSRI